MPNETAAAECRIHRDTVRLGMGFVMAQTKTPGRRTKGILTKNSGVSGLGVSGLRTWLVEGRDVLHVASR